MASAEATFDPGDLPRFPMSMADPGFAARNVSSWMAMVEAVVPMCSRRRTPRLRGICQRLQWRQQLGRRRRRLGRRRLPRAWRRVVPAEQGDNEAQMPRRIDPSHKPLSMTHSADLSALFSRLAIRRMSTAEAALLDRKGPERASVPSRLRRSEQRRCSQGRNASLVDRLDRFSLRSRNEGP